MTARRMIVQGVAGVALAGIGVVGGFVGRQAGAATASQAGVAGEVTRPAPFELRVLGVTAVGTDYEKPRNCIEGSADGVWKLVVTPSPGDDGVDWSTIALEDQNTHEQTDPIRAYRLSGPCWAPDGTYFVFSEGGVVKAASPGRSPLLLWQDTKDPRGGIYPARSYNFRWGTGMNSLLFVTVDDPAKEEPSTRLVTLRLR